MCVIHQDAVIVVLTLNFHTVKKSKVIAKAGKSGAFFICTSCYKQRKKLPPFLLLFWFNTGCKKNQILYRGMLEALDIGLYMK